MDFNPPTIRDPYGNVIATDPSAGSDRQLPDPDMSLGYDSDSAKRIMGKILNKIAVEECTEVHRSCRR